MLFFYIMLNYVILKCPTQAPQVLLPNISALRNVKFDLMALIKYTVWRRRPRFLIESCLICYFIHFNIFQVAFFIAIILAMLRS